MRVLAPALGGLRGLEHLDLWNDFDEWGLFDLAENIGKWTALSYLALPRPNEHDFDSLRYASVVSDMGLLLLTLCISDACVIAALSDLDEDLKALWRKLRPMLTPVALDECAPVFMQSLAGFRDLVAEKARWERWQRQCVESSLGVLACRVVIGCSLISALAPVFNFACQAR
eukprot:TRINITY_DN7105_c0_g2_i1.p1 TRINITY_DN7105_c0_g2~~TRINITY_DN7105_c0_g2_i1.p1  ORF type:complete len:172 (+),score=9.61 TRINITY_DN7105_c0_g2_i1:1-516(+)